MSSGFIYILTNEHMPGLVKIGMTTGDPNQRASQLFTTGVPGPFTVVERIATPNCADLEAVLHAEFHEARVSEGREFFRVDPEEVVEAAWAQLYCQVEGIVKRYLPDAEVAPFWRVFPEEDLEVLAEQTGYNPAEIFASFTLSDADDARRMRPKYEAKVKEIRSSEAKVDLKVVGEE